MRLIDADALQISTEFSDDGEYSWDIVPAFRIREAPTIDAAPVVRCRDCKHWNRDGNGYGDDESHCTNPDGLDNYARPDDFCSYGERRGDG